MKLTNIYLLPVVAISVLSLAAQNAQSQVFGSNGRSGVYVQGNGQGFAATYDKDGMHGVMVGPDGKVKRINGRDNNPFSNATGNSTFGRNGAFAGAVAGGAMAGRGANIAPGGFDPFSFVFGGGSGGVASMFAGPQGNQEAELAERTFRAGRYDEALALAKRAVRLEPANSDAIQVQGLAHFALAQYEQAAASAYEVLDNRTQWDWSSLRNMYVDTATYLNQLRQLEEAANRTDASAGQHFLLAYHYLMLDKSDNARTQLQHTLRIQPENRLAEEILGLLPPQI